MKSDLPTTSGADYATGSIVWLIDVCKISGYLLDLAHAYGGPKAKCLMRFGSRPEERGILANALVEHARTNSPGVEVVPPKGETKIVFEGTIVAPDGRDVPLRTVWKRRASLEMHFVSAIPLTR